MPPVSAIQRTMGPSLAARAALDDLFGSLFEPVRRHGDIGILTSAADGFAGPVTGLQHIGRHADGVQQRRLPAQRWASARRLSNDRVAGPELLRPGHGKIASGKFHGLMQTQVPRPRVKGVALPSGRAAIERATRSAQIGVMRKVNRLTHFGSSVAGLERFPSPAGRKVARHGSACSAFAVLTYGGDFL